MATDVEAMLAVAEMDADLVALAASPARPIVLAPARGVHPGVSPENLDVGVMLPYAPVHHLLFSLGAPNVLVMTSANRSSEPIAYQDDDARTRLRGLCDAMLVGERPIARRVDDSVVHATAFGPVIVRRARGYAPGVVAPLPSTTPILAVGADLKNSITLVVGGQAFVSQHIGDLEQRSSRDAFDETIRDLLAIYDVDPHDLIVVHDAHPEYVSTAHAHAIGGSRLVAVQHHRAHLASVLAERGRLDARVIGVAFDGTGYGDDGAIWGGELFAGSMVEGFTRVGHLRDAALPGGDAAAAFPVQAAAGFLAFVDDLPDLQAPPFSFPARFAEATRLVSSGVRTFRTTSAGRLFDTVAALLGFTRPVTFEGQAAIWLEHLARRSATDRAIEFPFVDGRFDYRRTLSTIIAARQDGAAPSDLARAFHHGVAEGLVRAIEQISACIDAEAVVLSGGVFQNVLLLSALKQRCDRRGLTVWTNREVPCNDGGISLGQAAIAAVTVAGDAASSRRG
jgi:hydrogenase maturation protein HypF